MSKQKVNYVRLEIRISELQTENPTVAPWEVDILRAMYGDTVQEIGFKEVERVPPSGSDEFARLATRYGPKNADVPTVAAVYGSFGPGVKALQDAIDAAYSPVETVVPETTSEAILNKASEQADPNTGASAENFDSLVA